MNTFYFRLFFFLYTAFALSFPLLAQNTYQFKSGLAAPTCHKYGRDAIYSDRLAFRLNNGTLQTPIEGQVLYSDPNGESIKWNGITVAEDGKFKGRELRDGYLYLTYRSGKEQTALLNVSGNSMVYVNGEPRTGDIYSDGYIYLPVRLKKGLNEFYVRTGRFSAWGGITAKLIFDEQPVYINTGDPTLPILIAGSASADLMGAIVIVNQTDKPVKGLRINSALSGKELTTSLPEIPPMTLRKVAFRFDASAIDKKGKHSCKLDLLQGNKIISSKEINIEAVARGEDYCETFVSEIDGSLQYYSVSPQVNPAKNAALFLSVHGAAVEAINQTRAYKSKEEGVLVAPTNRRPRGFNWEDWGRMDAMEVLSIAKKQFNPDPQRIYLTGHSMGGHGTWYLGATYAGQWAAIAPCAGYPTLATYGSADGKIPESGGSNMENLLLQASNPSNVFELIRNYNAGGVYIHHGDSDKTVSVDYARQMHKALSEFSKDICYYEYPGGSHWFGDESVDWKPIFDYFKWHTIPENTAVNAINFTTANPAISSQHYWTAILQQQKTLQYSRLKLSRSADLKTISGTTENVSLLSFTMEGLKPNNEVKIALDGQDTLTYTIKQEREVICLSRSASGWQLTDKGNEIDKGIVRNGTFKEPYNHRMVYVYGTKGSKEENEWAYNKARYDAETWYYRGNGAVDVVADKDFNPSRYPDRGIILFGNATTNVAWNLLLKNCPIQVKKGLITVDGKKYTGNDLGAYFMWPRPDSKLAGIAVISGTGLEGMRAADANQYFAGGSGFPDYMIFSSQLLQEGVKGVKDAGFYGNDWTIENGQRAN